MELKHIVLAVVLTLVVALILGVIIWANCTESGIAFFESWRTDLKKTKDDNNYETQKQVEDTCRAMIASYKTDVDKYNLYKGSEDPEKQDWAEAAYMRACQTANTYNEYILKNSYVWKDNIPADIMSRLETPVR